MTATLAEQPIHERTEAFDGRVYRWRSQGTPMLGYRLAVIDEATGIVVTAEVARAPLGDKGAAIDAMRTRLRRQIAAAYGKEG